MSSQAVRSRVALDVSRLPTIGFDNTAPLWWGNLLLIVIETVTFGVCAAMYFYYYRNFALFPPPLTGMTKIIDTTPGLTAATLNTVVIIATCVPMYFLVDRPARRGEKGALILGLAVCLALFTLMIVIRSYEFPALKVRWDTNAYGSIVWTTLVLHLLHLIVAFIEALIMLLYLLGNTLDEHKQLDPTLLAVYWYWVAAIWLPLYAMIYFAPRFL